MSDEQEEMDPQKTVCVVKHKGKEVGRVAATARNASDYVTGLAMHYGEIEVDYITDPMYARVDRLVRGAK